jgi:protein involved in polysaccharide export with SLBB domain
MTHFFTVLSKTMSSRTRTLLLRLASVLIGASLMIHPFHVAAKHAAMAQGDGLRRIAPPADADMPPIPIWSQHSDVGSAMPPSPLPTLRTPPAGPNSLGGPSPTNTEGDRETQRDRNTSRSSPSESDNAPQYADDDDADTVPDRLLKPPSRRADSQRYRADSPSRLPQPNAFQQFVFDTTGRRLDIFGHGLFDAAHANSYTALQNIAVPDDYMIGIDDAITLRVWGAVEGDLHLTVDRNGQITIPKVGTVTVAGVRTAQLNAVLKRAIGRNFTGFDASASLSKLRSIQIYVVGQAKRPGAYTVSSTSTLVNALFASGGPGSNGSMRKVELRRRGVLVGTVDLYSFITNGTAHGDRNVLPGDVIVIPPAGPRVALLGALDAPAIYELKGKHESLQDVLGYAGGASVLTSTDKVTIERVDDGAVLGLPGRSVESRNLDAAGLARVIKDGDVITLQKINPSFKNAITLRGNVAASLRYPYREGMHLSDLLPEPDALLTPDYFTRKNRLIQTDASEALKPRTVVLASNRVQSLIDEPNWRYAVIERMDRAKLTTRLLPFNLGAVVHKTDATQDLALEPGDIVTIFGSKDMRLPREDHTRLIRVDGEVRSAGVYELKPNDTLHSILMRAGGVTDAAYLYGTEFTREQTRLQQQANLAEASQRMEQQSGARLAALLANLSGSSGNGSSDAMTTQLVKQQQLQIERLKRMKASGRVSLELETTARAIEDLPPLALDNGDTLYVPPMPAFVTVVGAVNNENAIIWREGRTIADALRVAGVQNDLADRGRTFVIRADGSIFSRDTTSWRKSFDGTKLMPGDTVVVPEKVDPRSTATKFMAGLKDWSQIISQFGLGIAAIKVLNR